MENEKLKQNISNKSQWLRVIYMILFAVVLYITMLVVGLIANVQLLFVLLSGQRNENIAEFAANVSDYIYRIVAFLTYTDERLPYPFSSWKAQCRDKAVQPTTVIDNTNDQPE